MTHTVPPTTGSRTYGGAVRPRYGRITAFGTASLVCGIAFLGGVGVLPSGGTAAQAADRSSGSLELSGAVTRTTGGIGAPSDPGTTDDSAPSSESAASHGRPDQGMQPRRPQLNLLRVVFVAQEPFSHVGGRNVVLRVIGHLPDVARRGRVEDQLMAQIAADSTRGRLDPSACGGHLRVIAIIGHPAMMTRECREHIRCPCYRPRGMWTCELE